MAIPFYRKKIPSLNTSEMREVDRLMEQQYLISLTQMMENAGRNLAYLTSHRFCKSQLKGKNIVVLAGKGGNGGGVLVAARHLSNWGANVAVMQTNGSAKYQLVPLLQLSILGKMDVPAFDKSDAEWLNPPFKKVDVILDGMIGYSLSGKPKNSIAKMIRWANQSGSPILSLDVPTGIDATTAKVYTPSIHATATMTLALPKRGLLKDEIKDRVGELYLADISVPPSLYAAPSLGIKVEPIFARGEVLRIK